MESASARTVQLLEQIVKCTGVGTNIALLHLMWAMVTGAFLRSRGAIHSALTQCGFSEQEVRRSWRALRSGQWEIGRLVERFRAQVAAEGQWQASSSGGYKPVAVDLTAIWRPRLKGWPGKLYYRVARSSKVGIGFGLIADVGTIGQQRVPLLRAVVRGETAADSETTLQGHTLERVATLLRKDEVAIFDAGFELRALHEAGVGRYVVRQRSNMTARRAYLPAYSGWGRRHAFGQLVRPLPRARSGNKIAASDADSQQRFGYQGRQITARGWHQLTRRDQRLSEANHHFNVWVIDDPLYANPWVLATNLDCKAAVIYQLYVNRWPVEQIPQVSKQLLGLQRQFVFAHASCWRLGELAFLVGSMLAWLAAILPAMATGFWDRHPKKRRAVCAAASRALFFQMSGSLTHNFEKSSPSLPIYPLVWPLIVVQEPLIDPANLPSSLLMLSLRSTRHAAQLLPAYIGCLSAETRVNN